jgi:hypothetical protein
MRLRKETFTESAVWLWSQHDRTPDGGTVQAINIIFKKTINHTAEEDAVAAVW